MKTNKYVEDLRQTSDAELGAEFQLSEGDEKRGFSQ